MTARSLIYLYIFCACKIDTPPSKGEMFCLKCRHLPTLYSIDGRLVKHEYGALVEVFW